MKGKRQPLPLCLYFEVHQPRRLSDYDFFRIGVDSSYENGGLNEWVFSQVAESCYLPAISLFRDLIRTTGGQFRFALSLTGVVMEQMQEFRPDVLEAFQSLLATGSVELLGEPYYHSLASLFSRKDFGRQVALHGEKVRQLFGITPSVFRNTELIYSNRIATAAEELGFRGILGEGVEGGPSPNALVQAPGVKTIKTLLRNAGLSDDLAFRFSDRSWVEYPLGTGRFLEWIGMLEGDLVNLFMDLETIGEHQGRETGIFSFFEEFIPRAITLGHEFVTPGEAVERCEARERYDCSSPTSWADAERDPSAWLGNAMQQEACLKIHALEHMVMETRDSSLIHAWSTLQASDHFHHMSTKTGTDGMVHRYFSPYASPHEAYLYYMNVLADLQIRADRINLARTIAA